MGWLDKYNDHIPSAQGGDTIRSKSLGELEANVNAFGIGLPYLISKNFPDLRERIPDPSLAGLDELSDALRHAGAASDFAGEKWYNKLPLAARILIPNVAGLAHELDPRVGQNLPTQSASDLYNNFMGSLVGAMVKDKDSRAKIIGQMAKKNMLSDLSHPSSILGKFNKTLDSSNYKQGGILKYQGGGELDKMQKTFETNPDLFQKIPRSEYQSTIDYLKYNYQHPATVEKLKGYFPDLSGAELDDAVNNLQSNILSTLDTRQAYRWNDNKLPEIQKLDSNIADYILRGYDALNTGVNSILMAPAIPPELFQGKIGHEFGHRIGKIGNRGIEGNIPTYLDEMSKELFQNKYTPLPDKDAGRYNPFSIRNPILKAPGELKPIFDEIRILHKLDPGLNKEEVLKKISNNPRWKQLKEIYNEGDLLRMFVDEFAYNSNQSFPTENNILPKAQYGGKLKYQEGGEFPRYFEKKNIPLLVRPMYSLIENNPDVKSAVNSYNKLVDFYKNRKDGKMSPEEEAFRRDLISRKIEGYENYNTILTNNPNKPLSIPTGIGEEKPFEFLKKIANNTYYNDAEKQERKSDNWSFIKYRKELLNKFWGLPYDSTIIIPSKDTPSIKKDNISNYEWGREKTLQFFKDNPSEWNKLYNLALKNKRYVNNNSYNSSIGEGQLGDYTVSLTPDSALSFYDRWDLDLPIFKQLGYSKDFNEGLNNPFDFYMKISKKDIDEYKAKNKYQEGGSLKQKLIDKYKSQFEGLSYEEQLNKFNSLIPIIKMIPGGEKLLKDEAYRIGTQGGSYNRSIANILDETDRPNHYTGNRRHNNYRNLLRLGLYKDETGFQRIPDSIKQSIKIPLNSKEDTYKYKDIPSYWTDIEILDDSGQKTDSISYNDIRKFTKSLINNNREKKQLKQFKDPYLSYRADSILSKVGPGNTIITHSDSNYPFISNYDIDKSTYTIWDDLAGYSQRVRKDPKTNTLFFDINDVWDFDEDYSKRWKFKSNNSAYKSKEVSEQAKALNSVFNPFYLMNTTPVKKIGAPTKKDIEKSKVPVMYKKHGGIIKDNNGYWNPDNWGKPVEIASNNITMKGVRQPLLGISNTGDVQYMSPGNDYKFKGSKVTEIPLYQLGGYIPKVDTTKLVSNIKGKSAGEAFKNFTTLPFEDKLQFANDNFTELSKDPIILNLMKQEAYTNMSSSLSPFRNTSVVKGTYKGNLKPTERDFNRNYIYKDERGFKEVPKEVADSIRIRSDEDFPGAKSFFVDSNPQSGDSIDYNKVLHFTKGIIQRKRIKDKLPKLGYEELNRRANEVLANVGPSPNSVIASGEVGDMPLTIYDDAAGVSYRIRRDNNKTLVVDLKDQWDFNTTNGGSYLERWLIPFIQKNNLFGKEKFYKNQAELAQKIGTPFEILGSWPVKGEPKEYLQQFKKKQQGGQIKSNVQMKNQEHNLKELINFGNYNKKMKSSGWLDKYND